METKTTIYEDLSQSIREHDDFVVAYKKLISEVALCTLGLGTNTSLSLEIQKKLVESAAIFSLSNDADKEYALKILNGLLICDGSREILPAIKLILIRLGNFPTANKILDSFDYNKQDMTELDFGLRSEVVTKYISNKFNDEIMLTDFQTDLFNKLRQAFNISLSAPTSAGKSFILKQYITNLFATKTNLTVCFVVPTKALISQTHIDFLKEFEKLSLKDNVQVFTTTTQLDTDLFEKSNTRRLLILTQERLQYLLYFGKADSVQIDILVVDEAQKIGDSARGVLLEAVLLEAINRFKDMQIICSSPLATNPEMINQLLNCDNAKVLRSSFSPVPQYLYDVRITGKNVKLDIVYNGESIPLNIDLPVENRPAGVYANIAYLSHVFGKNQSNIIFANGPSAAEKIAEEICKFLKVKVSEDIREFIAFIQQEVHPLYRLADLLQYGVAFHYSDMPLFIKKRIEELYKEQHINFLSCTSTLLEGVNLPARNIFVYRPQEGLGNNMSEASFWNLVGRAGRLTYELVGNVFCIDTNKWPNKLFDSAKDYKIVSATEEMLKQNADSLVTYLLDPDIKDIGDLELYERAASLFIRNRLENKTQTVKNLIARRKVSDVNLDTVDQIDLLVETTSLKITVPLEILNRNSSIDPRKQQDLYEFLIENKEDFEKLIPLHPNSPSYYSRLCIILSIADQLVGINNNRFRYYAYFASRWIKEKTLGEIIADKIDYHCKTYNCIEKRDDSNFVNKTIHEVFEDINDKMTFHYARMAQCYVDLIEYVAKEINYNGNLDLSLPLYLEYGAYTNTSLHIISIGGSRSLAIRLTRLYNSSGSGTVENFKDWLFNNQNYISQTLPPSLQEEFYTLVL